MSSEYFCIKLHQFQESGAGRNAALNLTSVTGTTNGFIFQIINSLIESWGVRLTLFDCKPQELITQYAWNRPASQPLNVAKGESQGSKKYIYCSVKL